MKKKILIAGTMISSLLMAMPPNLQPPITSGGTGDSSSTEVRITANVVQGIAVNEASPIDFGNLARGMYTGKVSQNIPGKIHVKGAATDKVNLKLNTKTTDLVWTGANGTADANIATATKATITDVSVYGLDTTDTEVTLDAAGELTRVLTADFTAGKNGTENLGSNQKLGSYVGTVTVMATKVKP